MATPTPSPTPTATVAPNCYNPLVNGDMESDAGWIFLGLRPARYVSDLHTGSRSIFIGLESGEQPGSTLRPSAR